MNVERELLKRWLIDFGKIHPDVGLIKETKELLAQPEPFMFKDRKSTGSLIVHDAMYKRGYARAEVDLKREPLSDETIAKLWANKSPANEFECVRLVEKAHGIGGGE
jgi:hypothetical protein